MENSHTNSSAKSSIIKEKKDKVFLTFKPAKINKWNFILPLLFQLGLLAFISVTAINTYLTGKTVILQTLPVDPYSLLRGYYQVLNYEISQPRNIENIEGWEELITKNCVNKKRCSNLSNLPTGTKVYLVLKSVNETGKNNNSADDIQPWQPVRVSYKYPQKLQPSEVVIIGKYKDRRIKYNLEKYYIPEEQREQINKDINTAQQNRNQRQKIPFLVEIKVNNNGQAIPISLWINDQKYKF